MKMPLVALVFTYNKLIFKYKQLFSKYSATRFSWLRQRKSPAPCHILGGSAISFQPSMRPFAELKLTPIIRMGSPQDWNFSK